MIPLSWAADEIAASAKSLNLGSPRRSSHDRSILECGRATCRLLYKPRRRECIRGFFSGELQVTSRSRSRHSPNEGSRNRRSPNRGTLIRIRPQQGLRQRANPIRRPSLDASPIRRHTSPRDASPIRLRANRPIRRASLRRANPSRLRANRRASLRRAIRRRATPRHTSAPAQHRSCRTWLIDHGLRLVERVPWRLLKTSLNLISLRKTIPAQPRPGSRTALFPS